MKFRTGFYKDYDNKDLLEDGDIKQFYHAKHEIKCTAKRRRVLRKKRLH
jgi:hypothetical protein